MRYTPIDNALFGSAKFLIKAFALVSCAKMTCDGVKDLSNLANTPANAAARKMATKKVLIGSGGALLFSGIGKGMTRGFFHGISQGIGHSAARRVFQNRQV